MLSWSFVNEATTAIMCRPSSCSTPATRLAVRRPREGFRRRFLRENLLAQDFREPCMVLTRGRVPSETRNSDGANPFRGGYASGKNPGWPFPAFCVVRNPWNPTRTRSRSWASSSPFGFVPFGWNPGLQAEAAGPFLRRLIGAEKGHVRNYRSTAEN